MNLHLIHFAIVLLVLPGLLGCGNQDRQSKTKSLKNSETFNWDSLYTSQGLKNVQSVDSTIRVDLRYSSKNNFLGKDLYGTLEDAYLQPEALTKLAKASLLLQQNYPDLRLLIYDAARPRRVQQILWDESGIPLKERSQYVANPKSGSIHNYGCAIDLTLVDVTGAELDMGTDYDDFSSKAHTDQEQKLIQEGILTEKQVLNRKILRDVMTGAGFIPLKTEWWHFDAYSRDETTKKFNIVE